MDNDPQQYTNLAEKPEHKAVIDGFKAKLAAKLGTRQEVIVDEVDEDGIATCRTKADAPEIDGNLFIDEGAAHLQPGQIVTVEVDETGEYDLWGRLV